MRIERSTQSPAGLEPAVLEALWSVADQPSFHVEYGFRPAVGIYNVSMHQVWKRFLPVLDALDAVVRGRLFLDPDNATWHEALLSHQETLLYSLMEHIEDCENILQGFFPKADKKAGKKAVELFNRSIREYRTYLAPIVNGIKHYQLRLHAVVNYNENAEVVGYFVLGPDDKGELGPAAFVHSEGGEAYSFNWDLRYHFVNIYLLGHHLTNAICDLRECGTAPSNIDHTNDELITTIAARISRLPRWVFCSEMKADLPSINVVRAGDTTMLTIEHPAKTSDRLMIFRGCIRCDVLSDGVSTSFRFPQL